MTSIHIDPSAVKADIDPKIYSGFIEHMGRCIYGGIYEPGPLSDENGFRKDTIAALQELNVPLIRYPGGNFVSSYQWTDGIGPKDKRPRRPELAWLSEESNQFGTDEFLHWCKVANVEPYICLNMGTGTLEQALAWVEYLNSSGNTYWANERRKNGHEEPYGVKYFSLGNECWGEWQVEQMTAKDYAKKAVQWAKALKLLDPNIKLVLCGETGFSDWDRLVLQQAIKYIDYHSIHFYTVSKGDHDVNVTGTAAAEKGIEIAQNLIDLARITNGVDKSVKVCFDEWGVWDPIRAPGEKGAEEHYDLSDALAVACWLNVFVRQAASVGMANVAQSVNVISPICTSPKGLFKQTTFHPLKLFANHMQGQSLTVHVESPLYKGKTVPEWIQSTVPLPYLDVSAAKGSDGTIRLAVVNRNKSEDYSTSVLFAHANVINAKLYRVDHADIGAKNTFENPDEVVIKEEDLEFNGTIVFPKHSFSLVVFTIQQ